MNTQVVNVGAQGSIRQFDSMQTSNLSEAAPLEAQMAFQALMASIMGVAQAQDKSVPLAATPQLNHRAPIEEPTGQTTATVLHQFAHHNEALKFGSLPTSNFSQLGNLLDLQGAHAWLETMLGHVSTTEQPRSEAGLPQLEGVEPHTGSMPAATVNHLMKTARNGSPEQVAQTLQQISQRTGSLSATRSQEVTSVAAGLQASTHAEPVAQSQAQAGVSEATSSLVEQIVRGAQGTPGSSGSGQTSTSGEAQQFTGNSNQFAHRQHSSEQAAGGNIANGQAAAANGASFTMPVIDAGPTTGATTNATPASPTQQVAEQVQMSLENVVSGRPTRATIRLQPEELGNVRIQLQMQGGQLHLSIEAEQQQTGILLEQKLADLRATLESQGIKVAELTVASSRNASASGGRIEGLLDAAVHVRGSQPDAAHSGPGNFNQQQNPDQQPAFADHDQSPNPQGGQHPGHRAGGVDGNTEQQRIDSAPETPGQGQSTGQTTQAIEVDYYA